MRPKDKTIYEATPVDEWLDAEFYDGESNKFFLVELKKSKNQSVDEFILACKKVAADNFDEPAFVKLLDFDVAQMLGFDTY